MAKNERNPNQPNTPPATPSRTPMIILVVGSLAIAGLVAWALTRTVEPAVETPAPLPTAEAPVNPGTTAAPTATTPAPATSPNAGVTRIGVDELKPMIDRGAVTVVDVRDSVSYTNNHIPGAIHIPFARMESESQYLPKDKPIVTYCT